MFSDFCKGIRFFVNLDTVAAIGLRVISGKSRSQLASDTGATSGTASGAASDAALAGGGRESPRGLAAGRSGIFCAIFLKKEKTIDLA